MGEAYVAMSGPIPDFICRTFIKSGFITACVCVCGGGGGGVMSASAVPHFETAILVKVKRKRNDQ